MSKEPEYKAPDDHRDLRSFPSPDFDSQVARFSYLQRGVKEAMKLMLRDFDELFQSAQNGETVENVKMYEVLFAGIKTLSATGFHPEEIKYFESIFRPALLARIAKEFHNPSHTFHGRFQRLDTFLRNMNPLKVYKPSLGIKKYIAGVAAMVSAATGLGSFAVDTARSKSGPDTPQEISFTDKLIKVSPSDDLDPSVYQRAENTEIKDVAQVDKDDFEARERAVRDFKKHTKDLLKHGKLNYRRYFTDLERIVGGALPSSVVSAEENFLQLVKKLRPEVEGLSAEDYLRVIAPHIASPQSENDNRNYRSFFTDLFNEEVADDRYLGNCQARTSAYLTLTQELRPDILQNAFVQVFGGHIRYGMKDGDDLYAVDGIVLKLDPVELKGTAIAKPEDFFVNPFLTGKAYSPPDESRDPSANRKKNPNTDTVLPPADTLGLKKYDQRKEEGGLYASRLIDYSSVNVVTPVSRWVTREDISDPFQADTEENFIKKIHKDPDHTTAINIGELPLTPELASAVSRLHFIDQMFLNETGVISPMVSIVDDARQSDLVFAPSDLMVDLLRKSSSLQELHLEKLKFVSHSLKEYLSRQKNIKNLYVPSHLVKELEGVVSPEIVHGVDSIDQFLNSEYFNNLQALKDAHVDVNGAPDLDHIKSWYRNLPRYTLDAVNLFHNAQLVLIPPNASKFALGVVPNVTDPGISQYYEDNNSWRFGITDAASNLPASYRAQRIPKGSSEAEAMYLYQKFLRDDGLEIMPLYAYFGLLLNHRSDADGVHFDSRGPTYFAPPTLDSYSPKTLPSLPRALWSVERMNLTTMLNPQAFSHYDSSHVRPWLEGK